MQQCVNKGRKEDDSERVNMGVNNAKLTILWGRNTINMFVRPQNTQRVLWITLNETET